MSITVSSGETYRLHTKLTSADTVTLQPDSLLISDRLNFIAQAGDIILDSASGSERAAALEIKHVASVVSAEFMSNVLILNYANGLNTVLNITGTADNGSIHPYQAGSEYEPRQIHLMFLPSPVTRARTNAQLHTGPNPWLDPTRFLKRSSPS